MLATFIGVLQYAWLCKYTTYLYHLSVNLVQHSLVLLFFLDFDGQNLEEYFGRPRTFTQGFK